MAKINTYLQCYAAFPMLIMLLGNFLSMRTRRFYVKKLEAEGVAGSLLIRGGERGERIFLYMLLFDILMLLAGGADNYVLWKGDSPGFHSFFAGCSDLSYFLVLAAFLLYLESFARERGTVSYWPTRIGVVVAISYGILWFVSDFTGLIYTQDQQAIIPGPLYWPGQIGGYLVGMLALLTIYRYRSHFRSIELVAFLLFVILPLSGSLFRSAFGDITVMPLLITLSVAIIHSFVQLRQDRILEQQMMENAKLRFDVMIGQIRPHFIYNALTAIRSLCDMDSEAYLAVTKFSGFLRGSLDVLDARECIPMRAELETVENYLYIEQLRFEDKLEVVWDIRDQDFGVPACSLQVLVENAVRHGVRQKETGAGTVLIRCVTENGMHHITVEDDGTGFDPEGVSGGTGLRGLAQRLVTMCDGRLSLDSAPGKGCRAEIFIPEAGNAEGRKNNAKNQRDNAEE